jgi:cardiolipin synthase
MELPIPQWIIVMVGYLVALLVGLRIVMQRREPTATLAWVLGIFLVPYLGVLFYLVAGRRRLKRQVRKRKAKATIIEAKLDRHFADPGGQPAEDEMEEELGHESIDPSELMPRENNMLSRLSTRIGCRWPTQNNSVQLLLDAHATYSAMEAAIEAAKDHIHFQFYILQPDSTGRRFRDLLAIKARDGVEVRVLVDGLGSFGIESFMQPLVRAGGEYAEFLPVGRLRRHWHPNLRNHRKLVVVDGIVGFTGGVNIGDEYTGRKKKVGNWRDTHLRIEGPAVAHLQEVFAEDWHFATEKQPDDSRWFPSSELRHEEAKQTGRHRACSRGSASVHIIASGPDADTEPIQRIFFAAVCSATERVFLTTPYFVPDQAMRVALETAALRGVDVRILLPHRSDSPLVLHAGRSYYRELLRSGVRIFEYQRGILHAKTMLVDRDWATVGSANMDVRSFRINFEVNAVVYGFALADQLATVFRHDLRLAREITLSSLANKTLSQRAAESFARILSPIL